jgi:hypothetical protein
MCTLTKNPRHRTHTGRPLGTSEFVAQLEKETLRPLALRKGGRPKKTATDSLQARESERGHRSEVTRPVVPTSRAEDAREMGQPFAGLPARSLLFFSQVDLCYMLCDFSHNSIPHGRSYPHRLLSVLASERAASRSLECGRSPRTHSDDNCSRPTVPGPAPSRLLPGFGACNVTSPPACLSSTP